MPRAAVEVAVVVTNIPTKRMTSAILIDPVKKLFLLPNVSNMLLRILFVACMLSSMLLSSVAPSAILPKERSDVMYHRYDGGGMVIDGPSVLVRKNIANKVSLSGNYYVDHVSSASIDVITSGASEYTEERKEYSVDAALLEGKSLINIGYTNSEESDYEANAYRVDISQDFFGDMTTLSIGFSQADDEVRNNLDPSFEDTVDRRHYRFGLSQVFAKFMVASLNYEAISDEGFLNNPYRSVRFNDNSSQPEVYPRTRNSDAISLKFAFHLPIDAAIKLRVSDFSDSWSIESNSIELEYSQKLKKDWLFDVRTRYYQQTSARFYSDLFSATETQNFRARDKELSEFSNVSLGFGVSYTHELNRFLDRIQAGLQFDYLFFDYDNFRDASVDAELGSEPLYSFEAYALRVFTTLWY